jgi:hypothetical protein
LGASRVLGVGVFAVLISITFSISPVFSYDGTAQISENKNELPDWLEELLGQSGDNSENINELPDWLQYLLEESDGSSGNQYPFNENSRDKNEQHTKPTFGLSHENNQKIIDSGFKINNQTFSINDNFHTPFKEQVVKIGETNTFEAKLFASEGLRVQEFLFGIPEVGQAHNAELGVEVWFDYDGTIKQVKAIQNSNIIDESTFEATHQKTTCKSTDSEENCDAIKLSAVFLEPLKHKVMALKAIDFKNRYQITYLNEGIDISGESLNPMKTALIPSNVRDQGLIEVTQVAKYSPYWVSEDQRLFEKNRFGTFKEINYQFERFQDDGDVRTRTHSGFGGILHYEQKRATQIFDSSSLISEIPSTFAYEFPEMSSRMDEKLQQKMLEQEAIAKKILEEENIQARHY